MTSLVFAIWCWCKCRASQGALRTCWISQLAIALLLVCICSSASVLNSQNRPNFPMPGDGSDLPMMLQRIAIGGQWLVILAASILPAMDLRRSCRSSCAWVLCTVFYPAVLLFIVHITVQIAYDGVIYGIIPSRIGVACATIINSGIGFLWTTRVLGVAIAVLVLVLCIVDASGAGEEQNNQDSVLCPRCCYQRLHCRARCSECGWME